MIVIAVATAVTAAVTAAVTVAVAVAGVPGDAIAAVGASSTARHGIMLIIAVIRSRCCNDRRHSGGQHVGKCRRGSLAGKWWASRFGSAAVANQRLAGGGRLR